MRHVIDTSCPTGEQHPVGRLSAFTDPSGSTRLCDESGRLLASAVTGETGMDVQELIWLDDLPVGVLTDQTLYPIEADHLGSPRKVIDPASNQAIWDWPILDNPFGETQPNQNPDGNNQTFTLNLRFPGQQYDPETGLYYNYFRDYEPGTGRYVESDPIGLGGGVSTYGYVGGSPVDLFDVLGLRQGCPSGQRSVKVPGRYPSEFAAGGSWNGYDCVNDPQPQPDPGMTCSKTRHDCKKSCRARKTECSKRSHLYAAGAVVSSIGAVLSAETVAPVPQYCVAAALGFSASAATNDLVCDNIDCDKECPECGDQ